MSKYIKTETNIFEVVGENDKVYFVKAKGNPHNIYSKSKSHSGGVKESESLAELCDGFMVENCVDGEMYREFFSRYADAKAKYVSLLKDRRNLVRLSGVVCIETGFMFVAREVEGKGLELL